MPRSTTIIIGLLLTLILGIGLVFPRYQNLNLLQAEIKEKEIELQSEKGYSSELSDVSEKLKQYQESLTKINSALPAESRLPALFNFLQTAAAQNGLILKKIAPILTNPVGEELLREGWDPKIKETSINLVVTGSYPSFKNFLSKIEQTSRIIELESISFSGGLGAEEPVDFNLSIKVYSY